MVANSGTAFELSPRQRNDIEDVIMGLEQNTLRKPRRGTLYKKTKTSPRQLAGEKKLIRLEAD
jgi:hypothetical protein